jgi:hypothetical protein
MEAKMEAKSEKFEVLLGNKWTNQEEMKAKLYPNQEELMAAINSIWSELRQTRIGWRTSWRLWTNRPKTFVRSSTRLKKPSGTYN